jgi:hypothetical protein
MRRSPFRLITADPHLLEALRPFCDEATRARNTTLGSLRASVENEIQRLLPYGQAQAEMVAKAMALGVRTLSRRLSKEETTFAEVVGTLNADYSGFASDVYGRSDSGVFPPAIRGIRTEGSNPPSTDLSVRSKPRFDVRLDAAGF